MHRAARGYSLTTTLKAQAALSRTIEKSFEGLKPPLPASGPLSIDDQIRVANQDLQAAFQKHGAIKGAIGFHANPVGPLTIDRAKELMKDIASNSSESIRQNNQIQLQITNLNDLYRQKIESIYKAKEDTKAASFGLPFWVALAGSVTSLSGMVLAWRRDRREIVELNNTLAVTRAKGDA